MQTENRFFDDLAKVASGALNTLGGLKDEVESRFRERLERLANEMDLVSREELDAVKAVAQKARMEQERLEARVTALEAELKILKAQAKPSAESEDGAGESSRPKSDPSIAAAEI